MRNRALIQNSFRNKVISVYNGMKTPFQWQTTLYQIHQTNVYFIIISKATDN
jgi:hypothetical protein